LAIVAVIVAVPAAVVVRMFPLMAAPVFSAFFTDHVIALFVGIRQFKW